MDGWMTLQFNILFSVLQSYQDNIIVNKKVSVQCCAVLCNAVLLETESQLLRDSSQGHCDPKKEC